ncbi:hypothetical protein M0805_007394 [Coniferiporia weirii]|nr:hypothetical protein M0805_007394 [Coniferiporia weirii]
MDEEEANEVNANYVKLFQTHLTRVSDHLNGVNTGHGPCLPSFVPPAGYWTSEDKDLFFHALSTHSKLRPDLIAAEIPGKSVVDVCVYLDLLAEASAREPRKWKRSSFHPALEVSEKWVQFEESQVRTMAALGAKWEKEHRMERRANALRDERTALRDQIGERIAKGRDREYEKRRSMVFKEFQAMQEAQWEKEDYMGELCDVHLTVMDSILREAEEPSENTPVDQGPASSLPKATSLIPDSVTDPALLAISGPSYIHPASGEHETQHFSTTVSRPPTISAHLPTFTSQEDASNRTIPAIPSQPFPEVPSGSFSPDDTNVLSSLSPRSRRRHQKRLYMRRVRAERSGHVVSASVARLKPGRKANKEREHAFGREKAGEAGDEQQERNMDLDTNLEEAGFTIQEEDGKEEYFDLHSGKEGFDGFPGDGSDGLDRGIDDVNDFDGTQSVFRQNVGGATLPYRIRKELFSFGYNTAGLDSDGLGLFHLTALRRVMNLNASLRDVQDDVASCISAPTIKMLHAEVVCFVTDLLRRTIAIHEQQRRLKKHTKVWRLQESQKRLRVSTIHQALEMMDAARDKRHHFESLTSRLTALHKPTGKSLRKSKEISPSLGEEQDSDNSDVGDSRLQGSAQSDTEGDANVLTGCRVRAPLPQLRVYREINIPYVWHSSHSHLEPNPYDSSVSLPVESSDDLMPDMADDNLLLDELLKEEDIDSADVEAAKSAEAELWTRFSSNGDDASSRVLSWETEGLSTQKSGSRAEAQQLRFGQAQPKGVVRSRVFVEDSD